MLTPDPPLSPEQGRAEEGRRDVASRAEHGFEEAKKGLGGVSEDIQVLTLGPRSTR